MGKWFTGLLDRVFAVASALCFAQIPIFMQQYQQLLYGHIAELKVQVDAMQKVAAATGKSLPEYISRFTSSGDPDFIGQGQLMNGMVERTFSLTEASHSLSSATVLEKPFVFFNHMSWDIVSSTFSSFQAGIPFSLEGFIYAFVGVLFGYFSFLGFRSSASSFVRYIFLKRQTPVLKKVPVNNEEQKPQPTANSSEN